MGMHAQPAETSRVAPPHVVDPSVAVCLDPEAIFSRVDLTNHLGTETRWLAWHGRWKRVALLPPWVAMETLRATLAAPVPPARLGPSDVGATDDAQVRALMALLVEHGSVLEASGGVASLHDLDRARAQWLATARARLPPLVHVHLDGPGGGGGLARDWQPERPPIVIVEARDPSQHHERLAGLLSLPRAAFHELWLVGSSATTLGPWVDVAAELGARVVLQSEAGCLASDESWPAAHLERLRTVASSNDATVCLQVSGRAVTEMEAHRTAAWLRAHRVSGLRLDLVPGEDRPDAGAVARALEALHEEIHDLSIVGLPDAPTMIGLRAPDDRFLELGRAQAALRRGDVDWLRELELRYLESRVAALWRTQTGHQAPQTRRADSVLLDDDYYPMLATLLRLRPGSKLVDMGGATGRLARGLSRFVGDEGSAIDVDVDAVALFRGRDRAAADGLSRARFRCASCLDMPFADGAADAAVVYGFTAPLTDELDETTERALVEAQRVVRRGGRIVFGYPLATFFIGDDDVAAACGLGGKIGAATLRRLFSALDRAGLRVVSTLVPATRLVARAEFEVLTELCLDYLPSIDRPVHPWTDWLRELDADYSLGLAADLFVACEHR